MWNKVIPPGSPEWGRPKTTAGHPPGIIAGCQKGETASRAFCLNFCQHRPIRLVLYGGSVRGNSMGLLDDARSIARRDPAACNAWQVFMVYSGFHAVAIHRLSHWLYRHHMRCIARGVSQFARFLTGVEIHPGARIGKRLFIDHGMGVVIGETAQIGDDCTIYHGVTLGGTGKEKGKRHPTLGNNVLVGAGAKILGPFLVGDGAMIGANSVVLHEVPGEATVVGVPGRIVRHQGKPVSHSLELDHDSAPDPIEQDICKLMHRVMALERQIGTASQPFSRQNCPEQVQPDQLSPDQSGGTGVP